MIKKALKILVLFFLTAAFLLKYFIYIDPSKSCALIVLPAFLEFNNNTVMEAIKILKYTSPLEYNNLCTSVSTINPNPSCGGYEGGCYYPNHAKNIHVNINGRDPALTAAVMVHELCHLLQAKDGRAFVEDECYTKDSEILTRIVQIE